VTDELFILDAGPLGLATNSRDSGEAGRCRAWIRSALIEGSRVMVPEVVDYEVRRELIRAGRTKGLARLDVLVDQLGRLRIDSQAWHRAAELWADARRSGKPTAAPNALDADLLTASIAQLATEGGWRVVVVTDNPNHLGRFVDARDWRTLAAPEPPVA